MGRSRRRRLSKKQECARRRGLQACAAFAVLAAAVMLTTVVSFNLRPQQVVAIVVLETAIALVACRFVYLAVSRYLLPSWKVERLVYSQSAAWIDGKACTVSTPSHLAQGCWSRRRSLLVLIFWCCAWALVAAGAGYLSCSERGYRGDARGGAPSKVAT